MANAKIAFLVAVLSVLSKLLCDYLWDFVEHTNRPFLTQSTEIWGIVTFSQIIHGYFTRRKKHIRSLLMVERRTKVTHLKLALIREFFSAKIIVWVVNVYIYTISTSLEINVFLVIYFFKICRKNTCPLQRFPYGLGNLFKHIPS